MERSGLPEKALAPVLGGAATASGVPPGRGGAARSLPPHSFPNPRIRSSEPLSSSRRARGGPRPGPRPALPLRAFAGLRSGDVRALAGALALLALGAFTAPPAEAQSTPVVGIAVESSPVTEGTAATFKISGTNVPAGGLTVELHVSEPAGSDFVAARDQGDKTVRIPRGATSATYSVPTVDDTNREASGGVKVTVLPPDRNFSYSVDRRARFATVAVNDNDSGIDLTLSPSSIDEGGQAQWIKATVSLIGGTWSTDTNVTLSGEGITTVDDILTWDVHKTVTIPANRSRASVTLGVTPRDDLNHEGPETFRIIARATPGGFNLMDSEIVTIVDNDLPRLLGLTVNPVSGASDKLRISWNAFQGANDYRFEWKSGNQEYASGRRSTVGSANTSVMSVNLSPGTTYTYRVTALDTTTNPDTELAWREASGSTYSDPPPPPLARVAAASSPVTEGTDATFTVTLSHAVSDAVRVDFGLWWSNGRRYWDVEKQEWSQTGKFWDPDHTYPTSVQIAANATSATVTLPTHDDAVDEPDGYVQVVLGDGGKHYRTHGVRGQTPQDSAKVVVTDNDGAGRAARRGARRRGRGGADRPERIRRLGRAHETGRDLGRGARRGAVRRALEDRRRRLRRRGGGEHQQPHHHGPVRRHDLHGERGRAR